MVIFSKLLGKAEKILRKYSLEKDRNFK